MAGPLTVPWTPPHDPETPALSVVDMHTGGEPLRIVLAGCPEVVGPTLLAKRRYMRQHLDHVRRRLMFEPRGHRDMYGAVLVPSELPDAHLGVLFLNNEGYSSMCGHAVLALGRFALDFGLVPAPPSDAQEALVNIHCPCGLVAAFVECEGGRSRGPVRFHSVPAFVLATDFLVDVPGHGKVVVDVAYGGAFYAFVSAEKLGLDVCSAKTRDLVAAASAVTEAVKAQFKINHPDSEDLAFLYGTILTDGKDTYNEEPTTNICVFADEQVDRSPTGSGVTARIALQYHKGLLELNQTRAFKSSATGSVFTGKAVREAKCGDFKAVIVEVAGQAHYTAVDERSCCSAALPVFGVVTLLTAPVVRLLFCSMDKMRYEERKCFSICGLAFQHTEYRGECYVCHRLNSQHQKFIAKMKSKVQTFLKVEG